MCLAVLRNTPSRMLDQSLQNYTIRKITSVIQIVICDSYWGCLLRSCYTTNHKKVVLGSAFQDSKSALKQNLAPSGLMSQKQAWV